MDRRAIKRELTRQFRQSLDEAIAAVDQAPDGRWIAASEWQIRQIFQRLMQESFQKLLQAKLDAADEAAFSPSPRAGPLLATHARLIGLAEADQTLGRIDGAVWIYRQMCLALLGISSILLDFYHLAEHVRATARCCLGEGTEAALAWSQARLMQARASDVAGMLAAIEAMAKQVRSKAKRQSLQGLCQYIEQRRDMLDYAQALEAGQDIGSGPTEAECKTLTLRAKGPGMKWDRDNVAGMMNLAALRESGQWDSYWQRQAA